MCMKEISDTVIAEEAQQKEISTTLERKESTVAVKIWGFKLVGDNIDKNVKISSTAGNQRPVPALFSLLCSKRQGISRLTLGQ